MSEKICFKCGLLKPLSDYYVHKEMSDGHLGKCKECTRKDVKQREKELRKDSTWVEEEQKRHREKYYRLGYKEKHKPSYESKKKIMDNYWSKYPEKRKAHSVKSNIKRLSEEIHHWSYNDKHLKDVIHLTTKDHAKVHRFITYDQQFKMYRRKDNKELLDTKQKHQNYIQKILKNQ